MAFDVVRLLCSVDPNLAELRTVVATQTIATSRTSESSSRTSSSSSTGTRNSARFDVSLFSLAGSPGMLFKLLVVDHLLVVYNDDAVADCFPSTSSPSPSSAGRRSASPSRTATRASSAPQSSADLRPTSPRAPLPRHRALPQPRPRHLLPPQFASDGFCRTNLPDACEVIASSTGATPVPHLSRPLRPRGILRPDPSLERRLVLK